MYVHACGGGGGRGLWLIDAWQEYNWGIVQWGIDNHTTLLTRPRAPVEPTTPTTPTKAKKLGGKNPSPKTGSAGTRKRQVDVEIKEEGQMEVVKEVKEVKEEVKEVKEVEMADVVGAMGGLKLVPVSVRFGRRGAGR